MAPPRPSSNHPRFTPPHPATGRLSRNTRSSSSTLRLLPFISFAVGAHHVKNHDFSSLRVLDPVGEPINPEAWNWYNEHVGQEQWVIVDIFWQTETGFIVVTLFPGAIETKPGSATAPFFSIEPAILDLSLSLARNWRVTTSRVFSYLSNLGLQLPGLSTTTTTVTWRPA
ncbi:hypothetical protein M405DRAFT_208966 [Rhizopogon salebrosus TDB-379]|nr:hypothetical protein M405DRAFT_208966 [Rhizopogon salebrosus TDB-379]